MDVMHASQQQVPSRVDPGAATSTGGGQRLLGWAGVVGPAVFTGGFLVQEAFRREEYSPVRETISALEAGPNGWLQQLNFVLFGLLTIAFAVGLHRGVRPSRRGAAGPALLAVSGVGLLLAAALPLREDALGVTYDPGGHVVAGLLFFGTSAMGLVVLSRRLMCDPRWRALAPWTLASGATLLIGFVMTRLLVMPQDAPLHDVAGLVQRLLLLAVLFPCRFLLAVRLLRLAR